MAENALRLVDAIALVVGDAAQAREVIAQALVTSGRSEVPSDPRAMLSFVRGHVIERLVELIGPRTALVFLDDFRADLAETVPERSEQRPLEPLAVHSRRPSASSTALPQVTVVDHNPYSRAELARALIRSGLVVAAVASVRDDMTEGAAARVLVARVHRPTEIADLVTTLPSLHATSVVLLVDGASSDAADLARTSTIPCEVVPSSSPVASVTDIVLAHLHKPRAGRRTAG